MATGPCKQAEEVEIIDRGGHFFCRLHVCELVDELGRNERFDAILRLLVEPYYLQHVHFGEGVIVVA